jgi:hypothetical protein
VFLQPKQRFTICVRVGTPEKAAVDKWVERWRGVLRCQNEGCPRCADIYRDEALPDMLDQLPPGVIVSETWMDLGELEARYCRCIFHELSESERRGMSDALDANDQLWDGEISVADLRTLYAGQKNAFDGTPHEVEFQAVVNELDRLMLSEMSPDEQRRWACGSTDDFRQYIGRQLNGRLRNRATPGS